MNKKTFTTKRKAFSLIELAIVLIIIGLLVAGVTGGASLIKNATLRSVITEARGYQVAVNAFNERYQALPGDYNQVLGTMTGATPATTVGNANGQIEHYAANATASTVTGRMEGNIAFQQLRNGGFIDAVFTPATGDAGASGVSTFAALTPGSNIPGSRLANAGWVFDYVAANTQNVINLTGAVAAFTGTATTNAQNVTVTGIITPSDALSIDTKNDDGVANTGKVRSAGGVYTAGVSTGVGLSACNTAATYTTATTTNACALSFQVDTGA